MEYIDNVEFVKFWDELCHIVSAAMSGGHDNWRNQNDIDTVWSKSRSKMETEFIIYMTLKIIKNIVQNQKHSEKSEDGHDADKPWSDIEKRWSAMTVMIHTSKT